MFRNRDQAAIEYLAGVIATELGLAVDRLENAPERSREFDD
jgi:hypothetical protein